MKNKIIITLAILFLLLTPRLANAQSLGAAIQSSCPKGDSEKCTTAKLFSEGVVVLKFTNRSGQNNEPAEAVEFVYLENENKKFTELLHSVRSDDQLTVNIPELPAGKIYSLFYTLKGENQAKLYLIKQDLPVATAEAGTGSGQTGSGGTNTGGQNPTGGGTTGTGGGQQVASGDGKIRDGLEAIKGEFNTTGDIAGATSIGGLIVGVIRFLLALLLALAVLMIIIGGFIYLTSAGNEDKAKNGRKTVMYAIYGLIIVILSYMLVNVVERAISTGNPDE